MPKDSSNDSQSGRRPHSARFAIDTHEFGAPSRNTGVEASGILAMMKPVPTNCALSTLLSACKCGKKPTPWIGLRGRTVLLAIDAGNTNTVFAVHDGTRQLAQWRATTQDNRTADEYIVWLSQLMQLDNLDPAEIDAAIIATVVPQALFGLQTLCRRFFHCEPMVVGDPRVDLGLKINVTRPSDVGADRLVNAVGAHAEHPGSLIVVDFGTATTFDVVNKDGSYEGGAIAPGINLSAEALHMAAARLPNVAIRKPSSVIGKGTETAMQSGIYWGYIGLIEGLISRIQTEFGESMTVVATGGLAPLFDKGTDIIDGVDPDLTIRGLVDIYQRNEKK